MTDNTNLTGIFHQKVSSLPMTIASASRSFPILMNMLYVLLNISILQLPVKAVYIEKL